jgi:hypothetical protein
MVGFKPGQSPPPVKTPIFFTAIFRLLTVCFFPHQSYQKSCLSSADDDVLPAASYAFIEWWYKSIWLYVLPLIKEPRASASGDDDRLINFPLADARGSPGFHVTHY